MGSLLEVGNLPERDNPCVGVSSEVECGNKLSCKWSGNKCGVRIAWLHIMKCGTGFGTALAHHANSSLPPRAHIPTGRHMLDPGKLSVEFFQNMYPVEEWFRDVFKHPQSPGVHLPILENDYDDWKGYWVGMFRQPADRVHSSWHYFTQAQGSLLSFAHNVAGQQASMLSNGLAGLPRLRCELHGGGQTEHVPDCADTVAPNVALAIKRLEEGFGFVGIFEEFDLSICLFHKMFGSQCNAVEFEKVRPTRYNEANFAKVADIDMLVKEGDPWDTPVYEAAVRMFRRNVLLYNVSQSTCRQTCPGVAAFHGNERGHDGIVYKYPGGNSHAEYEHTHIVGRTGRASYVDYYGGERHSEGGLGRVRAGNDAGSVAGGGKGRRSADGERDLGRNAKSIGGGGFGGGKGRERCSGGGKDRRHFIGGFRGASAAGGVDRGKGRGSADGGRVFDYEPETK